MRAILFTCIITLFSFGFVNAQLLLSDVNNKEDVRSPYKLEITILDDPGESFQADIISFKNDLVSFVLNFRMEDELLSNETYKLLKDVTFLDIEMNCQIGAIDLTFCIENLINFGKSSFAIEPELIAYNSVVNNVIFSHESDFLISTTIAYCF